MPFSNICTFICRVYTIPVFVMCDTLALQDPCPSEDTEYYIWVAAVSSDGQGSYSARVSQTTKAGTYVYFALIQMYVCI